MLCVIAMDDGRGLTVYAAREDSQAFYVETLAEARKFNSAGDANEFWDAYYRRVGIVPNWDTKARVLELLWPNGGSPTAFDLGVEYVGRDVQPLTFSE